MSTQPFPLVQSMFDYIKKLHRTPCLLHGDLGTGQVHLKPGAKKLIEALHFLVTNNDEAEADKLTAMLDQAMEDSRQARKAGEPAEIP